MWKVTTNNVSRPLLSGWELTEKERKELDYIAEPDDLEQWSNEVNRFFRYRGNVYDCQEFARIIGKGQTSIGFEYHDLNGKLEKWHGIQTDSFFSGVVIRYCGDELDSVVCGLVTC